MKKPDINLIVFIVILIIYVGGQFLIGTYHPIKKQFAYDVPADVDFLYYGAIINSVKKSIPPENPAYAGVKLTQPFLQYYPAALLSIFANPYNSIRILNVIYLILFWLLLRNLFAGKYALQLIIMAAGSVFAVELNASGVDFIARGFTHLPFYILLAAALFCKKLPIRLVSIFAAALLNGYSMLMIIPFLAVITAFNRRREDIYLLLSSIAGTGAASLMVLSEVVELPLHFILVKSFFFDPVEIIKHAAPFIILAVFYRHRDMTILLIIAVIFGSLIHYNPFFPIFLVYFAGAMMLAEGEPRLPGAEPLAGLIAIVLFVGFLSASWLKYNPGKGSYYPRIDSRLDAALEWVRENTEKSDRFLAVNADFNNLALVMQYRSIYLGHTGHVSHIGLKWKERYDNTIKAYRMNHPPEIVDYIFFGPVEKEIFANVRPAYPVAYKDEFVTIYRAEK